jgi:zinc finger HIT domain-containing protein 1
MLSARNTTVQVVRSDALTDFQARRLQRRLEELEVSPSLSLDAHLTNGQRTNPTDIPTSSFIPGGNAKTPQAQQAQVDQKKKQSANVRKVLLARKSLKDWLEELASFDFSR